MSLFQLPVELLWEVFFFANNLSIRPYHLLKLRQVCKALDVHVINFVVNNAVFFYRDFIEGDSRSLFQGDELFLTRLIRYIATDCYYEGKNEWIDRLVETSKFILSLDDYRPEPEDVLEREYINTLIDAFVDSHCFFQEPYMLRALLIRSITDQELPPTMPGHDRLSTDLNVDALGRPQDIAIIVAVRKDDAALLKLLLRSGSRYPANSILKDPLNFTVLNGYQRAFKTLLGTNAVLRDARTYEYLPVAGNPGHPGEPDTEYQSCTAIHLAAKQNHVSMLRMLISSGFSLKATTDIGMTALHIAAQYNSTEIAKALPKNPVLVNVKDNYGRVPLYYAAVKNNLDVLRVLLSDHRVRINIKDGRKNSVLHHIMTDEHIPTIKLLVTHGDLEINSRNSNRDTPLHYAAWNGSQAMVKFLLGRRDIDVNAKNASGVTPMRKALENHHREIVQLLLDYPGINIDHGIIFNPKCLFLAVDYGFKEIIDLLLDPQSIDINRKDWRGNSPLSSACQRGDDAVVAVLLQRPDLDVNSRCEYGKTPLMKAVIKEQEFMVQILLNLPEVDVNARDNLGCTALMFAASIGPSFVRLLLNHPAININRTNYFGMTALSIARDHDLRTAIDMISQAGGV